jgi:hypothetical protein
MHNEAHMRTSQTTVDVTTALHYLRFYANFLTNTYTAQHAEMLKSKAAPKIATNV